MRAAAGRRRLALVIESSIQRRTLSSEEASLHVDRPANPIRGGEDRGA